MPKVILNGAMKKRLFYCDVLEATYDLNCVFPLIIKGCPTGQPLIIILKKI